MRKSGSIYPNQFRNDNDRGIGFVNSGNGPYSSTLLQKPNLFTSLILTVYTRTNQWLLAGPLAFASLLNFFIFSGKCLFKFPHECSEYISCTWVCFKAHSLTPNINDDSTQTTLCPHSQKGWGEGYTKHE